MSEDEIDALPVPELERLVGEKLLSTGVGWMHFLSSSGSGLITQAIIKKDWGIRISHGASWQNMSGLWYVMIDRPDRIASHTADDKTFGVALCRAALKAHEGHEIPIGENSLFRRHDFDLSREVPQ